MGKFLILISFFVITPSVLVLSLLFSLFLAYHAESTKSALYSNQQNTVAYAALPTSENSFEAQIIQQDGRSEAVRQFFARYNSPLEPHAALIVQTADKYELDHRLLPAIAMQESNLCKKNRPESFNCWGFGIYGTKYLHFDSYPDAIERVTKTLATKYKGRGLVTPEQIMSMYTPSSNGSWAFSVNHFMDQLE